MANSEYNLTVVDGTALTISLSGPAGPAGAGGGSSTISTSTLTTLTGYIYGNGTTIAGATVATSANTANTLVKRDAAGSAAFYTVGLYDSVANGTTYIEAGSYAVYFNSNTGTNIGIDPTYRVLSLLSSVAGSTPTYYTFPDASGSVPVYTGAPTAGQVLTSSGTNGAATWVTATSANTANTLVKRDATGGTSFFGDVTVNGDQSTSPRLFLGNVQTGANELETSGQLVFKGLILGNTDTFIQGNDGAMFVSSPINGATYINSSPIGASSSLAFTAVTGDTFYEFPNANGTVALINPSTGTQTFTGTQIFSSTTRPTSSATTATFAAAPASSLITKGDGDLRYGAFYSGVSIPQVSSTDTTPIKVASVVLPIGVYQIDSLVASVHGTVALCTIGLRSSNIIRITAYENYGNDGTAHLSNPIASDSFAASQKSAGSGVTFSRRVTGIVEIITAGTELSIEYSQATTNATASLTRKRAYITATKLS